LHLPPLNGHQALLLVDLCERLITAVWRAHGEEMVDVKANDLPLTRPATPEAPASDFDDDPF
jgi:hypothetical protein